MEESSKVAIVTGAARGIGRATVLRFVAGGYSVVSLDRSFDGVDSAKALGGANNRVTAITCDIGDERQVESATAQAIAQWGAIDVLVNNAGIVVTKPLQDTTWDDFTRIFATNVGGQFLVCKHVVPAMAARRRGSIVNVASVSGHVGYPNNSLYCATKGAVLAFTRALALEVAPYGIRVNSVSPGFVDTPMYRADVEGQAVRRGIKFEDALAADKADQPFQRIGSPSEIAEAIFFLGCDAASFVNAADLVVDCGWVAK